MPLQPLVSIIIPVYNSEVFLKQTIESALSQTWVNKEIIIVDDGSKDNSLAIAMQYEGNENLRIFSRQNSGSCATRNFGFKQSKGEYIQYLDADDLLSPTKVEAQLLVLTQLPQGYMASCGWGKFRKSPDEAVFMPQKVWGDYAPVDWLVTAWTGGGMMQTACWLTPRQLIESAGPWDETFKKNPNDDGEFFCRVVLKSSGIKYSERARVFYRTHEGERVSTMKSKESITSLLQTLNSYEKNILKYDSSSRIKIALATVYAEFLYQYFNIAPDLALLAEERIARLEINKIPNVGGRNFKFLSKVFGFKNLLKIRYAIRRY
jgi:glycosyltransferase involved in cell wall biosynthesis